MGMVATVVPAIATIALRDMTMAAISMTTVVARGVVHSPAVITISAERVRLARLARVGAVVVAAVSGTHVAASLKNAWRRLCVRLWRRVLSRPSVSVKILVNGPVIRESGS